MRGDSFNIHCVFFSIMIDCYKKGISVTLISTDDFNVA